MKSTFYRKAISVPVLEPIPDAPMCLTMKEELQMYENGNLQPNIQDRNVNFQCAPTDKPSEQSDALGLSFVSRTRYGAPNSDMPTGFRHVQERLGLTDNGDPMPPTSSEE